MLIPFSKIKYLRIWKYLGQFFAYLFFKYLKKHTYESKNTWDNFLLIPFWNMKYLRIWKYLRQFFAYPLFKYLKKHTYESENTWDNVLLMPFFKYLKKHTYESENTWGSFLLIPFSNIKYLRIWKYILQILRILKTPLFILITIYIKTIIQIDKHKAKYIITVCIPKIVIKNFLLFFFTVYKNERK